MDHCNRQLLIHAVKYNGRYDLMEVDNKDQSTSGRASKTGNGRFRELDLEIEFSKKVASGIPVQFFVLSLDTLASVATLATLASVASLASETHISGKTSGRRVSLMNIASP